MNINAKIGTFILGRVFGYSMQALDNVKIIFHDSKVYVPQSMHRRVLDWCRFYINHPGGGILSKKIRWLCYWKGLVMQADMFSKTCNIRMSTVQK